MTNIQEHPFYQVIIEAYDLAGYTYSEEVENFLYRKRRPPQSVEEKLGVAFGDDLANAGSDDEIEIMGCTLIALFKQFFLKVKSGDFYCPISEIKRVYRLSPEERIGISSGGYYRLFIAYWTFKTKLRLYEDLNIKTYGYTIIYFIDEMITDFDSMLAGAFFPTPGPVVLSKRKRREGIQDMLNKFAPDMTIKDLYEGADRKKARWPILKK